MLAIAERGAICLNFSALIICLADNDPTENAESKSASVNPLRYQCSTNAAVAFLRTS